MNDSNLVLDEFILICNLNKWSVLVHVVMMESSSYRTSTLKMLEKMPVFFLQMYNHAGMFLLMIAEHLPAYFAVPLLQITESQNVRGWKGPLWII